MTSTTLSCRMKILPQNKEIYRAIISAAVLCQWIAEHDTPPTDGEAEELAREIDRRLCEAWGEIFSLAVLEWRDGQ